MYWVWKSSESSIASSLNKDEKVDIKNRLKVGLVCCTHMAIRKMFQIAWVDEYRSDAISELSLAISQLISNEFKTISGIVPLLAAW